LSHYYTLIRTGPHKHTQHIVTMQQSSSSKRPLVKIRPQVFLSLSDHWSRTQTDCYGILFGERDASSAIIVLRSIEVYGISDDMVLRRNDIHRDMHTDHICLGMYYMGQKPQHDLDKIMENSPLIPQSILRSEDRINMVMNPFSWTQASELSQVPFKVVDYSCNVTLPTELHLATYDYIILDFIQNNTQSCDVATVDNVLMEAQTSAGTPINGSRTVLQTLLSLNTSQDYDVLLAKLVDAQEQAHVQKKEGKKTDMVLQKKTQMLKYLLTEERQPTQKTPESPTIETDQYAQSNAIKKHEQSMAAVTALSLLSSNVAIQARFAKQMKYQQMQAIPSTQWPERNIDFFTGSAVPTKATTIPNSSLIEKIFMAE